MAAIASFVPSWGVMEIAIEDEATVLIVMSNCFCRNRDGTALVITLEVRERGDREVISYCRRRAKKKNRCRR